MFHHFLYDVSKQQNIVISNPFLSEENDKMKIIHYFMNII